MSLAEYRSLKPSQWNDERRADLRAGWEAGKSAGVIAAELNAKYGTDFSRNAVIGARNRLNLEKRRTVNRSATRPQRPRTKVFVFRQRPGSLPPDLALLKPTINDLEIPLAQRKQLLDLERCHCHFPVGDVGEPDFFFCGGVTLEDQSYCAHHYEVTHKHES